MKRVIPVLVIASSSTLSAEIAEAALGSCPGNTKPVTITMAQNDADLRQLNNCNGIDKKFIIPSGVTPTEVCYKSKSNVVAYLDETPNDNTDPLKKVNIKTLSRVLTEFDSAAFPFLPPHTPQTFTTIFHISGAIQGEFYTIDTFNPFVIPPTESIAVQDVPGTGDFKSVSGSGSDTVAGGGQTVTISSLVLNLCI
jgi:hypothetical protein